MNTDTMPETVDIVSKNINAACDNFKEIAKNTKKLKFEHIDSWLYKASVNFKKENNSQYSNTYPRYNYGTIIKVDFGINTGSELSSPHFAIVLEKFDSIKSDSITVLPLTSQQKKNNLPLSELIIDEFTKRLNKYVEKLNSEISEIINSNDTREKVIEKQEELKIIQQMIEYYSNYAKNSYACINQITTISKKKIMHPKNKFDIIGRAKCNSRTMQLISEAIIKKYTNIKLNKNN